MATRDYFAVFGYTGVTGLAPTFIAFISSTGAAGTPPAISEPGSKGIYKWSYDASATLITFILDGATSFLGSSRYIPGVLEGQDQFGVTLNAIGVSIGAFSNTAIALGNSSIALGVSNLASNSTQIALGLSTIGLIGSTASSYGTTGIDPVDIMGYLKRAQEFMEGNQTYTKSSGVLDFYNRAGSTLLREKTVADSTTATTKT